MAKLAVEQASKAMSVEPPPLRPRVRLRIGVTGHRPGKKLPNENVDAVAQSVDAIFHALTDALPPVMDETRWAFGREDAELAVVSPLAEGADRIVAEAGLRAGAGLEVVLPLTRADYEQDFETEASRAGFRDLLDRAASVFEIDRPPGPLSRKRGYEAAGLVMLAHADVLIAIWDQGEADGIGGTANIVAQAVNEGAPVILIDPTAPTDIRLLWTGDLDLPPLHVRIEDLPRRDALPMMPEVVRALVAPPPDPPVGLGAFYAQAAARTHGVPLYAMLLGGLGVRALRRGDFIDLPRPEDDPAGGWRDRFPTGAACDPLTATVASALLPTVGVTDRLAVRYGEIHRSAMVFTILGAAVAVSLALLGLASDLHGCCLRATDRLAIRAGLVLLETGLIAAVLLTGRTGARRQWRERWLNYRRAAEWLRHLRILSLVGARSPIGRPRHPITGSQGAERGSRLEQDDWVAWYARSLERRLPLPSRVTDAAFLAEVRAAVVEAELDGQIAYHHANSHRMAAANRRLRGASAFLFGAAVVAGAGFLAAFLVQRATGWPWAEGARVFVAALTVAFPVLGAALSAVRAQGDFEAVGERSAATAARLETVRNALQTEALDFTRLADRVQHAAEVMSLDLAEWQTLFRTRPLGLPAWAAPTGWRRQANSA